MPDNAARYAREHAHYVEDLDFWSEVADEAGGPILDLGCAVGRVTIPLARDGHDMWALDRSDAMLARLQADAEAVGLETAVRIRTVCQDMTLFDIDQRFAAVIAPMNTLQTLITPDLQVACLERVRRHLAPGGEFAFDVALPDVGDITSTIGVVRHTATHHDPNADVTLIHSAWYDDFDPIDQRLYFTIQIDEIDAEGRMTRFLRPHEVHVYQPQELVHLLARAGMEPVEVLGDFDGTPVDAGSERQIYRCKAR